MLDKRKTSIEVDYSDKYMSFKDFMQASSDHVRTIVSDRKKNEANEVP